MIFLGINFHQSIKLFRGGEAQLVRRSFLPKTLCPTQQPVRSGVFIMHEKYCADPAVLLYAPNEPNKDTGSKKKKRELAQSWSRCLRLGVFSRADALKCPNLKQSLTRQQHCC